MHYTSPKLLPAPSEHAPPSQCSAAAKPIQAQRLNISDQIGEPSQKDKLTFANLAHQFETGLNRCHPEMEMETVL